MPILELVPKVEPVELVPEAAGLVVKSAVLTLTLHLPSMPILSFNDYPDTRLWVYSYAWEKYIFIYLRVSRNLPAGQACPTDHEIDVIMEDLQGLLKRRVVREEYADSGLHLPDHGREKLANYDSIRQPLRREVSKINYQSGKNKKRNATNTLGLNLGGACRMETYTLEDYKARPHISDAINGRFYLFGEVNYFYITHPFLPTIGLNFTEDTVIQAVRTEIWKTYPFILKNNLLQTWKFQKL